jgi:hypothetical protein
MKDYERDMVFFQNEFLIENKSGVLSKIKYDLLTFGGHNNLPYTATSILVGYPAAVVAQVILFYFKNYYMNYIPKMKILYFLLEHFPLFLFIYLFLYLFFLFILS